MPPPKITEVVSTDYVVLRMEMGKPTFVEANRTTKISAEATAKCLAGRYPKRSYAVAKVISCVTTSYTDI